MSQNLSSAAIIIGTLRFKVLKNAPTEHSAILSTCIKLPSVFKTFVLYIFKWPLKTGFTVPESHCHLHQAGYQFL